MDISLLHTAAVHVAAFDEIFARATSDARLHHQERANLPTRLGAVALALAAACVSLLGADGLPYRMDPI